MIFVVNNLETNGGTTFVLRFIRNWSNKICRKPQVLVLSRGVNCDLELDFYKIANVYYLDEFIYKGLPKSLSRIFLFHGWIVDWKKFFKVIDETHFHSLSIFGLYFSLFVSKVKPIKISLGIYHKNELLFRTNLSFLKNTILDLVHSNLKIGFVFFNEYCEKAYGEFLGTRNHDTIVVPIGIEFNIRSFSAARCVGNRIVSIGNLNEFKTYNEHVIRAIVVLCEKFDLEYHIYGEGESKEYLQSLADSLGVSHLVFFGGQISYDDFSRIVNSAKLFVGSGTAVLEASTQGVVSITGIDSCNLPLSYGYVSDIDGYDYNEFVDGKVVYTFEYLIENILNCSDIEYNLLVQKSLDTASRFHVSKTILGFESLERRLKTFSIHEVGRMKLFVATLIFLFVGVLDLFGLDRTFRYRRNQG